MEIAKKDLHRPRPNYREAAQVVLEGIKPLENDVDPLPQQTLGPNVQRLARQPPRASRLSPGSEDTAPFAASNVGLFAVHPGLGNSPPPRINHSFIRNSSPSTTPRGMAPRDIGSEQLNGHDAGDSHDPNILDADPAEGWRQGSPSSRRPRPSAKATRIILATRPSPNHQVVKWQA